MSITSFRFVLFVLVVLFVYYAVPARFRWMILLISSAAFYLSFQVWGIFVLIATALVVWYFALLIQKQKELLADWMKENRETASKEERKAKKELYTKKQRSYLIAAVAVCLALLFLCKYYGKLAFSIGELLHAKLWTAEKILLPLGISYYSLQLIGYITDVQRDVTAAEKNPLKVILFGVFFLSIMQGPFNRYDRLMPQLTDPERKRPDRKQMKIAGYRIFWGYVKKMCIADQVGILAGEVFSHYARYSGLGICLGIVCFAVQLYADFSGYMDIVVGIGQLFGIQLPENFRQPFFSKSMSEFWRRWHITLGEWLKDYVLYPILKSKPFKTLGKFLNEKLGKNAGRMIPVFAGDLILWVLIGAWHGAGFNYVFGVGILQFLYILIGELTEKLRSGAKTALHIREAGILWHVVQSLIVTALMLFAWVFFNSPSMHDALGVLSRVFAGGIRGAQISVLFSGESALADASLRNFAVYIVLCIAALLTVDLVHEKGVCISEAAMEKGFAAEAALFVVLFFALVIFGAYGSRYSAGNFIYFEF